MKKYTVEISAYGSNIVTVWANDMDEAIDIAITDYAEEMVEYDGEVIDVEDE